MAGFSVIFEIITRIMRRSRNFLYLCSIFFFLFIKGTAQAQFDPEPPTDPCNPVFNPDVDPPPLPPECIPIDGGLAFLLAAGVGYGVVKNRSTGKKEQTKSGIF